VCGPEFYTETLPMLGIQYGCPSRFQSPHYKVFTAHKVTQLT